MFKLILMALSLLLWGSGAGTERSASAYGQVFEAAGPGWDPDGSPAPQQGDDTGPATDAGPGWDPDGLK